MLLNAGNSMLQQQEATCAEERWQQHAAPWPRNMCAEEHCCLRMLHLSQAAACVKQRSCHSAAWGHVMATSAGDTDLSLWASLPPTSPTGCALGAYQHSIATSAGPCGMAARGHGRLCLSGHRHSAGWASGCEDHAPQHRLPARSVSRGQGARRWVLQRQPEEHTCPAQCQVSLVEAKGTSGSVLQGQPLTHKRCTAASLRGEGS